MHLVKRARCCLAPMANSLAIHNDGMLSCCELAPNMMSRSAAKCALVFIDHLVLFLTHVALKLIYCSCLTQ